ncbi:MAG: hypothetical protein DWQ01_05225 [Planctomycetota bacterium]|nr:MAG: hypothetical protein DWQ01_05225 [Planctomycetota bacterium]
MKQILLPVLLAGLFAGALGGMLGTMISTPTEGATSEEVSLDAESLRSLKALESQLMELSGRVESLEDRPMAALARREIANNESVDGLPAELEELARALQAQGGENQMPEAFQAQVKKTLEDIREQEDQEREQRREEARVQRREDFLSRVQEELWLDDEQVNRMRELMALNDQKRQQMFEDARESGDWQTVRDQFQDWREESMNQLSSILTPTQYEDYTSKYGNSIGGGRGSFGRSGGFGGGANPGSGGGGASRRGGGGPF